MRCALSSPDAVGILAIKLPLQRVVGNVLPNGLKIPLIANHVVVEAMLPEPARIAGPALLCHSLPILVGGKGLEPLNDGGQLQSLRLLWIYGS